MAIELRLPFPPSANHYNAIRIIKNKSGKLVPMHYRTKRAKAFYAEVHQTFNEGGKWLPMEGRIALSVELSPPTLRIVDISNCLKCIEDALQEAGAFINDAQIDLLSVRRLRKDPEGVGCADVVIQSLDGE